MMPCLFLHFSGAGDGRKAKLGSDRMLSPLNLALTHTRTDTKNAFWRRTFLCREGLLPGGKTKIYLQSMLPKIMVFLLSLSFYKNNVHMSLVEINNTRVFNFP